MALHPDAATAGGPGPGLDQDLVHVPAQGPDPPRGDQGQNLAPRVVPPPDHLYQSREFLALHLPEHQGKLHLVKSVMKVMTEAFPTVCSQFIFYCS